MSEQAPATGATTNLETVELEGAAVEEPTIGLMGGSAHIPVGALPPGTTVTFTTTITLVITAPPEPAAPEPQRPRHMGMR